MIKRKMERGGGGRCGTLAGNAEHPVVSRTKTEREERGRGRRGKGAGEEGGRKEGREGEKGKLITSIQDMFNCCISCILWWAVS